MAIDVLTIFRAACDRCGELYDHADDISACDNDAIDEATSHGWVIAGCDACLPCPSCAESSDFTSACGCGTPISRDRDRTSPSPRRVRTLDHRDADQPHPRPPITDSTAGDTP